MLLALRNSEFLEFVAFRLIRHEHMLFSQVLLRLTTFRNWRHMDSKGESNRRQVFVLWAVWSEHSDISVRCYLQAQPHHSLCLKKKKKWLKGLELKDPTPDPESNSLSHLWSWAFLRGQWGRRKMSQSWWVVSRSTFSSAWAPRYLGRCSTPSARPLAPPGLYLPASSLHPSSCAERALSLSPATRPDSGT